MGTITDAINLGKAYLDRLYKEISDTEAVIKDYMAPPIWIKVQETGEVVHAGESKLDYYEEVPWMKSRTWLLKPGRTRFNAGESWCADEETTDYIFWTDGPGMGSFRSTKLRLRVSLVSKNDQQTVGAYFEMLEYWGPRTVEVYWGGTKVWTGDNVGQIQWLENAYGWESVRYVGRHHTRLAAWDYEMILSDATKGAKLHAFMNNKGFTKDVYDPFFGQSGGYPDNFITTKEVYPEPENRWDALPKGEGYTPYRSVLTSRVMRDAYIGNLVAQFMPPWLDFLAPLIAAVTENAGALGLTIRSSPFYDCAQAMHLLQKYGASAASDAKWYLERAGWDGKGTRRKVYFDLPGDRPPCFEVSRRAAYEGYSLPCFIAACCKLYAVNGDGDAQAWANEAVKVLLGCQWKWPSPEWHNVDRYTPEHVGGFMGSYRMGSAPQYVTQNTTLTFIRDQLTRVYVPIHHRSGPDHAGFIPVSGEPSALAIMGLDWYRDTFGEEP